MVTDGSLQRDWDALGCAAVLDHRLSLQSLLERLDQHAAAVDRSRRPGRIEIGPARRAPGGRSIAVVGSGGVGTTTVAMALCQALGCDGSATVLVDGARRGNLAMYHHIGDVIPGMPELVDAHRSDRLDPAEVRSLTFEVPSRGYSVLLGRRRVADWVTLRRRSVDAALDALLRSFSTVVIDIDPDLDGQADTGSPDVEDRHAVSLAALHTADLVAVVGRPGLHGVHALTALIDDVLCAGTPPHRVLPVVVDSARSPAARATLAASIPRLVGDAGAPADEPLQPVLQLRRVRGMDDIHDRVAPMPASLCRPLGRAAQHLLDGWARAHRDESRTGSGPASSRRRSTQSPIIEATSHESRHVTTRTDRASGPAPGDQCSDRRRHPRRISTTSCSHRGGHRRLAR